MKIKMIEDIKRLFDEGKLLYFVVNDKCNNEFFYAYDEKCKTLPIYKVEINSDGVAKNPGVRYRPNLVGFINFEYIDIEETEKLIKGDGIMTKSDLKDGMAAENRKGNRMFVLSGCFILEKNTYDPISYYNNNLKNIHHEELDIIKVYKTYANDLNRLFKDEHLSLIWKREEKSEAEIKLDDIEKQIEELQKSAKELREEIKSK